jgi:hypothetical protein
MAWVTIQQLAKEIDWGPDCLLVDDLTGRGHNDTEERDERKTERDSDKLWEDGI